MNFFNELMNFFFECDEEKHNAAIVENNEIFIKSRKSFETLNTYIQNARFLGKNR